MTDLFQLLHQRPVLVHLECNVCSAHQVPIQIELGKRGPVARGGKMGGVKQANGGIDIRMKVRRTWKDSQGMVAQREKEHIY